MQYIIIPGDSTNRLIILCKQTDVLDLFKIKDK
jgi:hypothetical protein